MRCKPCLIALAAGLSATAIAGVASAQPLDLRLSERAEAAPSAAIKLASPAARPAPDLANPLDPLAPTTLQPQALETAVFAKTALNHRFARREDLTGSVGFLCGLQPGHAVGGADGAYGVDPHGRFVGAKFSIAFK